jgi:HTH-type transcriptional regulator/antitoxin HigA
MKNELRIKPIRNDADHDAALREIERLWGAREGTPEGDRLEVLTTLVEAYEHKHFPMDAAGSDRGDQVPP